MFDFHLLSSILCVLLISIDNTVALRGAVNLDSLTFDKVISRFAATLVKFDIQYPYGEKHDEYGVVANSLKNTKDVLVAEVGVQDFGDNENQDLADRFGVKKDDFPVVKLFLQKDLQNPLTFLANEEFKADRIKQFVKKSTGIRILLDKCLKDFDELAETFMAPTTTKEMREKLVREAETKAGKLSDDEKKSADVYVKLMQKVVERGEKFVASEHERVKNIISGKVSEAKKKEMQARLNILQSFTASGEPKAAKSEL